MLEITSHRQGAILNHNHGIETENSLKVTVSGISDSGQPVKVNGIPAVMEGRLFSAEIELTQKLNQVTASVTTPYGEYSQSIVLVWDKKSTRRYNCYIDDHSFVFTELARQRPQRAFDHFYLAGLKKIHDEYGFKVTLGNGFPICLVVKVDWYDAPRLGLRPSEHGLLQSEPLAKHDFLHIALIYYIYKFSPSQ